VFRPKQGIQQVTGANGDIKKSRHTGEGRCLWQKWIPAFAGKDVESAPHTEPSECI
jgi:hypothetical protein